MPRLKKLRHWKIFQFQQTSHYIFTLRTSKVSDILMMLCYYCDYVSIKNCLNLNNFFFLMTQNFSIFGKKSEMRIINTYIIGYYNTSVRITDLVSYITYVVCANFIHKWRDLQIKVYSERQIFWETFHCSFYLLLEFLPEICWEEIAEKILFLYFILISGLGLEPWLSV